MTEPNIPLALALLERDCPCSECHGNPVVDTWICQGRMLCCNGTGKVPLLDPELVRKPCPCEYIYDGINHYLDASDGNRCCKLQIYDLGHRLDTCDACQGRNWVPSPDILDWVWALNKEGWRVSTKRHDRADGDGFFEAAARALGEYMAAETKL